MRILIVEDAIGKEAMVNVDYITRIYESGYPELGKSVIATVDGGFTFCKESVQDVIKALENY